MIDTAVVLRKLATMREHVRRARARRPSSLDRLQHDTDLQDALAMSVLVAIQEAIDIAFHIVVDEGYGLPSSNAEAFELIARNGVLGPSLAQRMTEAAGLRNRLAHGYATLDLGRLWNELPDGLDALDAYASAIAAHVPGED